MLRRISILCMLAAALVIYGAVDSHAAWQPDGQAVCTASNDQYWPTTCTDGAGGAFIVWYDRRNGTDYNISVQRVNSAGNPQWAVDGLILCSAPGDQMYPAGFQTYVVTGDLATDLEGRDRPTHFRGVTTICLKLFTICKPHRA